MGLILKNPNGQYAFDITGVGGQWVEAPTPELKLGPKQTSMDRTMSSAMRRTRA